MTRLLFPLLQILGLIHSAIAIPVYGADDLTAPVDLDGYPVCEASAVLDVPCQPPSTGLCLLVGDNENDEKVFRYDVDQTGRLKKTQPWEIDLDDVEVKDIEALSRTEDGLFIVGSHSRKKSCKTQEERLRIARLERQGTGNEWSPKIVAETNLATWKDLAAHCVDKLIVPPSPEAAEPARSLREAVCRALAASEAAADQAIGSDGDPCSKTVEAFNIEGAVSLPEPGGKTRIWVGLRAPLVDGKAVLLRLAAFGDTPQPVKFDGVATIALKTRGVRELTSRDGWLWGIAGGRLDGDEPSQLWKVRLDSLRDGAQITDVTVLGESLPASSEGLVIDAFSNRAIVVVDGDRGEDKKKCKEPARQLTVPLSPTTAWGNPEVSIGAPLVSAAATSSGDAVTMLFDGAAVGLDGASGDRVATRFFEIRVPTAVDDEASLLGFKQDLRGSIAKTAGARAVIVAEMHGVIETIDLPYGDGNGHDAVVLPLLRHRFSVEERLAKSRDPSGFRSVPPYVARFLLVAERQTRQDAVTVEIDSLDVRSIVERSGG